MVNERLQEVSDLMVTILRREHVDTRMNCTIESLNRLSRGVITIRDALVGVLAAWKANDRKQQTESSERDMCPIPGRQGYSISIDACYHALAWRYATGWCWRSANKLPKARNRPREEHHFYTNAMLTIDALFDRRAQQGT